MVAARAAADGRRTVWPVAPADWIPAAGGPGLFPDVGTSCPTVHRSGAPRCPVTCADAVSGVAGVQDVVCSLRHLVLDNSASLSNAGVAYVVLKDWASAIRRPGPVGHATRPCVEPSPRSRTPRSSSFHPAIQGIGDAGGFSMQVELRDGSSNFAKLQSLARTVVGDARTPIRSRAVEHDDPHRRPASDDHGEPGAKAEALQVTTGPVFQTPVDLCRLQLRRPDQQFGLTFQVYAQAEPSRSS